MSCNCINALEKQFVENGHKGRKVERAEFILVDVFSGKSSSEIMLYYKDAKRGQVVQAIHKYCPYCGTEIKKSKS